MNRIIRMQRRGVAIAGGMLIVAFVATWATSINRPFAADDWLYLNFYQQHGWLGASWNPANGLFRPVLYMWLWALHAVLGLHPVLYHIIDAVIFAAEGVLVWLLADRLGLGKAAPLAAAIVVLHSSMATPVIWISAVSSPLAVALALGALVMIYTRSGIMGSVAAGGLFALGLLTREVVVGAPIVAAVLLVASRHTLRVAVFRTASLWVVLIGYMIVRAAAGAGNPPGPYHQQLSGQTVRNGWTLAQIAGDFYGARSSLAVAAAIVVLLVIVAGSVLSPQRNFVVAGLVWAVVGGLPVVGLLSHSIDPYYLDFALPGIALAAAATVAPLLDKLREVRFLASIALAFATLGFVGNWVGGKETEQYVVDAAHASVLVHQVRTTFPHPEPGNTVVVMDPKDQISWDESVVTRDGDLFKVLYADPSLRVVFQPTGQ